MEAEHGGEDAGDEQHVGDVGQGDARRAEVRDDQAERDAGLGVRGGGDDLVRSGTDGQTLVTKSSAADEPE